ncbi:MAG: sugar transferase [Bryobacterales bacterium]|nr:sugar transferase [Bryobacterales bacterium]
MFSQHRRKAGVLFGLSDILVIALAFEAAYQSRVWLPFEQVFYLMVPVKALLLGFSVLAWVVIGRWLNVYDHLDSGRPGRILGDSFKQTALGITSLAAFQYALRLQFPLSRSFLGLLALYAWVFLCVSRLAGRSLTGLIYREFGARHHVLVVGRGASARRLGEALERSARYGVKLVGFLANEPGSVLLDAQYPVYPMEELPQLLRRQVIDEVIFTVEKQDLTEFEDVLVQCDQEGVRTRIVLDFFPHINSEMYLDRLGSIPLLTFSAAPYDQVRLLAKRIMDVMAAGLALLVLLPFMLAVAIVIRLTSPGPAIFKQVRCGLNGRLFTCYKFRSMVRNAEDLRPQLEHLSIRATAFKLANDPRLTPVGRWLRKFSIDELPQLWNILKGDMSLVGPRPSVPNEVESYKGWQRRRLRMRPGLTCSWALEGRDKVDFETWMNMDLQYIDNWSLALDWKILLLTVPRVLAGKGAS